MTHNSTQTTFQQIENLPARTKIEGWMNEDRMMFLKFVFCLTVFLLISIDSKAESMTFAENDINQTPSGVVAAGNLLKNDFDPIDDIQWVRSVSCFNGFGNQISGLIGGRPFEVHSISGVLAGTISIYLDGYYEFHPESDFIGKVSVSYVVENTHGATDVATLAIQVIPMDDPNTNNQPIAHDDTNTTEMGMSVGGNVITSSDFDFEKGHLIVRAIFADLDGDGVMAEPLNVGSEGVVYGKDVARNPMMAGVIRLNSNGSYSFDPEAEFYGKLSITYKITDGTEDAEANLTILVLPNAGNRIVANDEATITKVNMVRSGNMLTNDYGIGSDFQTIVEAKNNRGMSLRIDGTTENELRSRGSLVIGEDGSFRYSPYGEYVGTEMITYVVCDAAGAICDTATLYLTTVPLYNFLDSGIFEGIALLDDDSDNVNFGQSGGSSNIKNNMSRKANEVVEDFSLYPNPGMIGDGFINLSFKSITGHAQIQIADVNGRVVRRLMTDANIDEVNNLQIEVADLTEGRYHLQLIDGTSAHSEIFILMNKN